MKGFTLIELVLFIIITSLVGSTILLAMITALEKIPSTYQQGVALQTARQCMEWFIGQRRIKRYTTLTFLIIF